jgi:Mrp family chromosome partitioning ATPase
LAARRTSDIFNALRSEADYVLLDCPPILPVADSVILAALVDATLLVVTAGSTTKRQTHRAVELLQQVDAPLIGAVLNGVGTAEGYGYGYGYAYAYGHAGDRPRRWPWQWRRSASSPPAARETAKTPV